MADSSPDAQASHASHPAAAYPPRVTGVVFDNRTPYAALQFDTVDQHGAAFHVFVAKIGYALGACAADGTAPLTALEQPAPLNAADRHVGGDTSASVLEESDLAPFKPHCDVVVNATAYAPRGLPVREFPARLSVGKAIDKTLIITGPRRFERKPAATRALSVPVALGTLGLVRPDAWRLTDPEALTQLPLRYDYAAGGQCRISSDDAAAQRVPAANRLPSPGHGTATPGRWIAHEASQHNPLGLGFTRNWYLEALRCQHIPAPQIAYAARPPSVDRFRRCADGGPDPEPAGMGPVGRAWLPRRALIGKIEEKTHWDPDEVPRLPARFDYAYWNCAPADQQCPYPHSGEHVTLVNLCRPDSPTASIAENGDTVLRFCLPHQAMFLLAVNPEQQVLVLPLDIDTVTISPDACRVDLVWRACVSAGTGISESRLMHITEAAQMERLQLLVHRQAAPAAPTDRH